MSLLAQEQETYQAVWDTVEDAYAERSPLETALPIFLDCVGDQRGTVLDAGCASGKGLLALQAAGFTPTGCDIVDGRIEDARALPFIEASLWHDLSPVAYLAGVERFDWVVCCDVLEHLPKQFTMLAVANMLRVAKLGVWLTVSTVPDHFGVWVGKSLHQTVEGFPWWLAALGELGHVVNARDLVHAASFYLEPKR